MKIKNAIKFLWKNRTAVLLIVAVILVILWFNQCNRTGYFKDQIKFEQQRQEQNMAALTDSIKKYVNKDGDTSYQKPIAEMTLDEIKDNLPVIYDAIVAAGSEIKIITTQKIVYRDTGSVNNVLNELDKDKYSLAFDYASEDSLLTLKGKSLFTAFPYAADDGKLGLKIFPGKTHFDKTEIKFGLTTGVKKDEDGINRIFVTPSSDKITITDIQGVDLSNYVKKDDIPPTKKKRFGVGFQIGYGAVFGKNNQLYHGPTISAGINYSIIKF